MRTPDISERLAEAKKAYDELMELTTIEKLECNDFGSGKEGERIEHLLREVFMGLRSRRYFESGFYSPREIYARQRQRIEDRKPGSDCGELPPEAPVVYVAAPLLDFYKEVILAKGEKLYRAFHVMEAEQFEQAKLEGREMRRFSRGPDQMPPDDSANDRPWPIIREGLAALLGTLDDGDSGHQLHLHWEKSTRRVSIIDVVEDVGELIGMQWFQPDDWLENQRLLQPILIDRPQSVIPDRVKRRLSEAYCAFIFGLWMASVALMRSLVESAMKENAYRLGVDSKYEHEAGKKWDKKMGHLGSDIAETIPTLEEPIRTVVEAGNYVLHPETNDSILELPVTRSKALECIRASKHIVETLYAGIVK